MTDPTADRPDLETFWQQAEQCLGFPPPQACRNGMQANLDLLAQHTRVLEAAIGAAED